MSAVSFELFPPRTPPAKEQLGPMLDRLTGIGPNFISVTCGASGNGGVEATVDLVREIASSRPVPVAGHLTAAGRTRAEVDGTVRDYWDAGVRHIVALRGDMPEMGARFEPHPQGYAGSLELIEGIRRHGDFEVSVAAYPEPHPESRSFAADLDHLARKAAAGASRAITQFCFRTEAIVRLRDEVSRAGIALRIVPGIMFATNFVGTSRMAARCGASIPDWLAGRFDGLDEDLETRKMVAAIVAATQIEELRREGFDAFHFYVLNRAEVVSAVCRQLDLGPAVGGTTR